MVGRLLTFVAALAVLAAGCTASVNAHASERDTRATTAEEAATGSTPGSSSTAQANPHASYIAGITKLTAVLDSPGGTQIALVEPTTPNGSNTRLAVVEAPGPRDEWLHVYLDQRPNGTTGWIWADDAEVTWTLLSIEIDLSDRELRLYDGAELVTKGSVAIGETSTPTPTGTTFVTDTLATPDPDTLYGPFALGLAMYSDVVTEYAGGNGQVAIHGTNSPHLLGGAVSLGCVRVHNDLIRLLAGMVPLGTPVTIVD